MKKSIQLFTLLALSSTLFPACKTRHVTIARTDVSSIADETRVVSRDSVSVDTGRVRTDIITATNTRDSAQVIIIPDTGAVVHVLLAPNQNFAYTGKAKSIDYKNMGLDRSLVDEQIEEHKAEITKTILADSSVTKTMTHTSSTNKTLISQSKLHILVWIAALVLIIAILLMLRKTLNFKL